MLRSFLLQFFARGAVELALHPDQKIALMFRLATG